MQKLVKSGSCWHLSMRCLNGSSREWSDIRKGRKKQFEADTPLIQETSAPSAKKCFINCPISGLFLLILLSFLGT